MSLVDNNTESEKTVINAIVVKDASLKFGIFGLPRPWSKGIPPSDKQEKTLKRKKIVSSNFELDVENDVQDIMSPDRKKVGMGRYLFYEC